MPEGDTIFRAARTLDRALGGRVVTRFDTVLPQLARVDEDTPRRRPHGGERSSPQGKWMMMRFSGGLILLTHMLMSGSWHIYRPGERVAAGAVPHAHRDRDGGMIAVAFTGTGGRVSHGGDRWRAAQGLQGSLGPDLLEDGLRRGGGDREPAGGARNGGRGRRCCGNRWWRGSGMSSSARSVSRRG